MRRDRFGALAALIVAAAGLLAVGVSYGERIREHSGEYYALLAAAGGGMIFLGFAGNLMTLFLGLEWFSIALYILCAIDGERERSLEAGLKYLVVGSFGSAILLFGSALVYGATGRIGFEQIAAATAAQDLKGDALLVGGLAMLLVGFGFKTSAAPFHMWTPDVYEGAPTPVTGFMSAATKTAALVVMLRVLVTAFPAEKQLWTITVAVLVCASLVVGNFAALAQTNLKRLLAYSSISQAGFMLIGVAAGNRLGAEAVLYYLIPYGAMSIGAFAVIAARERELGAAVTLDNLAGFGWERPLLGASMATFMLGFAGFPLTGGFMGKFLVFSAADERGWWWLTVVGVAGDRAEPLLLPRRRARDVHAPEPRSCSSPRPAARRPGSSCCRSWRRRASRSPSRRSSSCSRCSTWPRRRSPRCRTRRRGSRGRDLRAAPRSAPRCRAGPSPRAPRPWRCRGAA